MPVLDVPNRPKPKDKKPQDAGADNHPPAEGRARPPDGGPGKPAPPPNRRWLFPALIPVPVILYLVWRKKRT